MITVPAVDPFAPLVDGDYRDELVTVTRCRVREPGRVRTGHFEVDWQDGRVRLQHSLTRHRIDNDLAGLLAEELFAPGWITGAEVFERLLTGIVLTSAKDSHPAWETFYRNTLRRLEFLHAGAGPVTHRHGSLAEFAPVYQRAAQLAGYGSVLEVGSCFGFLSLQIAARGAAVTATDVSAGTVRLLSAMAPALGYDVRTLTCDAARVPCPDRSVDTVLVVHLLEHLDPAHGTAVVAEAVRLARHRVVVAVPFEDEPTAAFGHLRTVTPADLDDLGRQPGWHRETQNHHGGWLILDRRT